jgi:hypothetical protein
VLIFTSERNEKFLPPPKKSDKLTRMRYVLLGKIKELTLLTEYTLVTSAVALYTYVPLSY